MQITYYGHACFHLQTKQGAVLFDPFLTGNPLAPVTAEEVTADAILVSHGHGDHLGDAIPIAKRLGVPIVATAELAGYCQKQGAPTHAMSIGGDHSFPFGWVKLTPAFHGSSVETEDGVIYTGQPAGFILRAGGKTAYFAGDTGLFGDMALLGEMYDLDVAMLPIGGNYTMGIDDAVRAAKMLRAEAVIPMHYNTFPVIEQDPEEFVRRLQALRLDCLVLDYGATVWI